MHVQGHVVDQAVSLVVAGVVPARSVAHTPLLFPSSLLPLPLGAGADVELAVLPVVVPVLALKHTIVSGVVVAPLVSLG